MRPWRSALFLFVLGLRPVFCQTVPQEDAVRIREFYRLATAVQDQIWPQWSKTPAPLLLITQQTEFLSHYPSPPKDFVKTGDDLFARARQFPANLQATFPAFGGAAVIVFGDPASVGSKSSTAWLITLMHEHFHQLQDSQPGYYQGVEELGLSHGDRSGMWMLNYPFPYEKVPDNFGNLRELLLAALAESDPHKFHAAADKYVSARKEFFAHLSPEDSKYLNFQLWQEGIARYTQVKTAEAAANYSPTPEYQALADYESFSAYASQARKQTLDELRSIDMSKEKREAVYAWGAGEGFLLDRLEPKWQQEYFEHPFALAYFSAQR